jgi:hypothetical protein
VSGRTLAIDFQAGAPPQEDEESAHAPAPRDDDTLLEEFKTMFSAVEEGERPSEPG